MDCDICCMRRWPIVARSRSTTPACSSVNPAVPSEAYSSSLRSELYCAGALAPFPAAPSSASRHSPVAGSRVMRSRCGCRIRSYMSASFARSFTSLNRSRGTHRSSVGCPGTPSPGFTPCPVGSGAVAVPGAPVAGGWPAPPAPAGGAFNAWPASAASDGSTVTPGTTSPRSPSLRHALSTQRSITTPMLFSDGGCRLQGGRAPAAPMPGGPGTISVNRFQAA